jgi:Archaeal/vacuolar-type H+-ATPase subunit I
MAIVNMNKFTLLTFHEYKADLLRKLQKFEDVHFRNLQKEGLGEDYDFLKEDSSPDQILRYEAMLDKVNFTLYNLKPYAPKTSMTAKRPTVSFEEFDNYLSTYDYASVCSKVKDLGDQMAAAKIEVARLKADSEGLRLWKGLDVAPGELDGFSATHYLLGTVARAGSEAFREQMETQFDTLYLEFLGNIREDVAVLMIMPADILRDVSAEARNQGFVRAVLPFTGIPAELMRENDNKIEQLQAGSAQALEEIGTLGGEYDKLLIVKDCLNTLIARETAVGNFMKTGALVLIEGWVPAKEAAEFQSIVESACGQDYYLEQEAEEESSEEVPIKLQNNKFVSAFESVTQMYSMPCYAELDPTPLMSICYTLIFGFMVGDVGYGLLVVLATTFAITKMDMNPGGKKFMEFFRWLGFGTILGGMVYGSFFGYEVIKLASDGMGGRKAIISTSDDMVVLILFSIVIGVIHCMIGVIMVAFERLHSKDYMGILYDSVFTFMAVMGAIVWLLGIIMLGEPWGSAGKWSLIIGAIGILMFSARDSQTMVGRIANGFYNVYGLTAFMGDIVSYTRIAALALSGAYIGYSFNLMQGMLPGGLGWLGRIPILLVGHGLNIGLALLGAYVHCARLQYVEFFSKFYTGGGKSYRPLKLQNDYVHINK